MLRENLVIIGGIILFLGSCTYLFDTIRGKIKPNRVTWFLWAVVPFIVFFAQIQQGIGIESFMAFMGGLMPLLIFIASFVNKNAYWEIKRLDILCGTLSVIGLILWYITKTGNIAILFGIISDFLAALPTIIKSYFEPETENYIEYFTSGTSGLLTLFSINALTFGTVAFPLYFFLINISMGILIKFSLGKWLSKRIFHVKK